MTRLYFVRHGENQANIERTYSYKVVDYPLSVKGILQAHQTAEYFTNRNIQAIYSSPLQRALQTAQIISDKLNVRPIIVRSEFFEFNVGALDGKPMIKKNIEQFVPVLIEWVKGNYDPAFPQGENGHEFYCRFITGLQIIMNHHPNDNVIIVGHGGQFTLCIHRLCPNATWDILFAKEKKNCAITQVKLSRENGKLIGKMINWASIDHLSGIAMDFTPSEVPHQIIEAVLNNR
jgi:broad specificity phosphatase PhoE